MENKICVAWRGDACLGIKKVNSKTLFRQCRQNAAFQSRKNVIEGFFLSCGHDSGTSLEVKSQANARVALLSYAMPSLGNLCEGERERKKWVRISAK